MNLATLHPDKHYFLACSFGPDSMALFSLLLEGGFSFTVLHVNYHRRGQDSNDEETRLREYCAANHISCIVYDTTGLEIKGNFQAWARKVRYQFFASMVQAHPTSPGVLVAHHQDDVIETYLMQKASQRIAFYYGIESQTVIEGVTIIRPLLHLRKRELLQRVQDQHVPYAVDSSNLEEKYTRNRVRHQIVEHLTEEKRQNILQEIATRNEANRRLIDTFNQGLVDKSIAKTIDFKNYPLEEYLFVMSYFLHSNGLSRMLSKAKLIEMLHMLSREKSPNAVLYEDKHMRVCRTYDFIEVRAVTSPEPYLYQLPSPGVLDVDLLYFDGQNPRNLRRIPESVYPIHIRPAHANDIVRVAGYTKKLRRLFIDWKMPMALRKRWPVFVGRDEQIVFVPRYQQHYIKTSDNPLLLRL